MTIRPLLRYPDRRLAIPAHPVTAFDDGLRELAQDLLDTMRAAPGIGITAPHIGVPLRVVVLELDANDGARTYVNPEITWASPEMILHREGSISMPGVNDEVQRHARVRISYWDIDVDRTESSLRLRSNSCASRSAIDRTRKCWCCPTFAGPRQRTYGEEPEKPQASE